MVGSGPLLLTRTGSGYAKCQALQEVVNVSQYPVEMLFGFGRVLLSVTDLLKLQHDTVRELHWTMVCEGAHKVKAGLCLCLQGPWVLLSVIQCAAPTESMSNSCWAALTSWGAAGSSETSAQVKYDPREKEHSRTSSEHLDLRDPRTACPRWIRVMPRRQGAQARILQTDSQLGKERGCCCLDSMLWSVASQRFPANEKVMIISSPIASQ